MSLSEITNEADYLRHITIYVNSNWMSGFPHKLKVIHSDEISSLPGDPRYVICLVLPMPEGGEYDVLQSDLPTPPMEQCTGEILRSYGMLIRAMLTLYTEGRREAFREGTEHVTRNVLTSALEMCHINDPVISAALRYSAVLNTSDKKG